MPGLLDHGHGQQVYRTKPCGVRSSWPWGKAQVSAPISVWELTPSQEACAGVLSPSDPPSLGRSTGYLAAQHFGNNGRSLLSLPAPHWDRTELLDASLPQSTPSHPLCLALSLHGNADSSLMDLWGFQSVETMDRNLKKVSVQKKNGSPIGRAGVMSGVGDQLRSAGRRPWDFSRLVIAVLKP